MLLWVDGIRAEPTFGGFRAVVAVVVVVVIVVIVVIMVVVSFIHVVGY